MRTVEYIGKINAIKLINQRALPFSLEYIISSDYLETALHIQTMTVRGAGAIGVTAAYGLAQGIKMGNDKEEVYETLLHTRPTAVDLKNGLDYVMKRANRPVVAAHEFCEMNVRDCAGIGRIGKRLIGQGSRVLTYCNAGSLAFVEHGSATAPMYAAKDDGVSFEVFCCETRPRLQGAKLTSWELSVNGIQNTVITDNSAGILMRQKRIDLVIVGADRIIEKTGEVFNKIGTYSLAVLAKYHKVPFFVAAPRSTFDKKSALGLDSVIEERDTHEVTTMDGTRLMAEESSVLNYAFDITPRKLITGIITQRGII